MKEKRIKNATPIYLAGTFWLIAAALVPMYFIFNIVLTFIGSIIVYKITAKLFKDKVIIEEVPVNTGDTNADDFITKGRNLVSELTNLGNTDLPVLKIIENSSRILSIIEKDTTKIKDIHLSVDYFLPTTIKLLKSKKEIVDPTAIEGAKEAIIKISDALERQVAGLLSDKTVDVINESKVVNEIIKREVGINDF